MKLSPENLLRKTHYGMRIYTYVLRQYDPGIILSGSSTFQPIPNPFTGTRTLIITLDGGVATHHDLADPSFRGDAFDFAQLYFRADTREALYFMINQVLHLGLKVEAGEDLAWLEGEDDSWRPVVSFFMPSIRNTRPLKELSLWQVRDLIAGPAYSAITTRLRQLEDPQERREYKASKFPFVTFSGSFRFRQEKALKKHSGLIALDFDHLPYLQETRSLLLEDPEFDTEMLFVSPSGTGLKWIVRFDPAAVQQKEFFLSTASYLKRTYRLLPDPAAKDVPRACFLANDPDVYLHPRHEKIGRHDSLNSLTH